MNFDSTIQCCIMLLLFITVMMVRPSMAEEPIKYFLRDMNTTIEGTIEVENDKLRGVIDGLKHYRLLPGDFSYGKYHFDGLATVMKFQFDVNQNGKIVASFFAKPYESQAYQDKDDHKCVFFGTGIGPYIPSVLPTGGVCFLNPGVNLLPINGELWLTIDTASWGRVDSETLETVPNAKAEVKLMIAENKVNIEEVAKRRAEVATQKIAQAEAAAIKEIRSLTVSVATSAARDLIKANLKDADQDALIKSGTDSLDAKLH